MLIFDFLASELLDIAPFAWTGIFCSFIAGAMIGLERQLLGKPVGIRTSVLICLGTYVFVRVVAMDNGTNVDSTRVIGQIITGIGFIGAGVMMARDGTIIGVTSAASIWVLAAVGCTIGKEYYHQGIILAAISVGALIGIDFFEHHFKPLQRGVHSRYTFRNTDRGIYDINDIDPTREKSQQREG